LQKLCERSLKKVTLIVDTSLPAGSVVADRYGIERVIARGERKWTYLASDLKAKGHRHVALAVMEPGPTSAASQREVEMMGTVGAHDCIVTLHDFDLESPSPYLVYEYLPGGRLRDHCADLAAQESQVGLADFFRTARQLSRAIAHVHERGVIHRDVAATNVLLDERGVAHLGDFDMAISADEVSLADVQPMKPEGFAAPELLSGTNPDHRADLYALGAVLYELLTLTPPPSDDIATLAVPPSQLRNDIPPRLDALIFSMLAADREDRPKNAQAVLDELRDIEKTADLELLIADGESASLEFKQTMRWDTKLQQRSSDVLKACIRTVGAFLNTCDGTLLIGVADTGELTGLDDDLKDFSEKKTVDEFELKFRNSLSASIKPDPNKLVTLSFPFVRGMQICCVAVSQAPRPMFLIDKGRSELCMRRGNASQSLTDAMQAYEYIRDHWRW
jgi:serine/threonine protein kinase